MASPGKHQTYQTVGIKEDVNDIITNISPMDTYVFSNTADVKAIQTYHETQTDALDATAANAAVEGADASFADLTASVRVGNYTQILQKTYAVSETNEAASAYGRKSELSYQKQKAMRAIARDMEYAMVINATSASGASGTARTMKGVLGWIATNVTTGTGTGSEALTESMYNDNLQLVWAQGGQAPYTTLCGAFQKRKFDGFTTNTRYAMADESKLTSAVNVYESSFGVATVRLHHILNNTSPSVVINLGDMNLWKKAWLRRTTDRQIAKIGDADRYQCIGEFTLESRQEKGSGKITGLTTS